MLGASVAAVVRFIRIMKGKMESTELKSKKLVYYTGQTPQLRTKWVFCFNLFDKSWSKQEEQAPPQMYTGQTPQLRTKSIFF